jgi:hypothetical protein
LETNEYNIRYNDSIDIVHEQPIEVYKQCVIEFKLPKIDLSFENGSESSSHLHYEIEIKKGEKTETVITHE